MQGTGRTGIVVIGRNEGERLVACLESVRGAGACTIYVDSGSHDGSVERARPRCDSVVALDPARPFSAARARNEGFAALRAARPAIPPPVLGLVGRVVPIKDIKTFVRAMRTVVAEIPEAEGWIVGPDDEDPRYADECRALARSLGLERAVRFLGFRPAEEVLPQLGLGVLTSISEALPLFVLESFAAGVPVVATDVGSCRALVEGGDAADRARGVAGAIAPFAAPEALARAAVELLRDPARWRRAAAAGVARVEALYTRDQMFTEYRALYRAALQEAAPHGRDRLRAS